MAHKFCITIPVYNEEARLEKGVRTLWAFLQKNNLSARIDIADNGSTDQTRSLARLLANELENVTLTEVAEKGVGRALQASWDRATEDIVGYMDVDLSTDIYAFLKVVQMFEANEADVVNGSRLIKGSEVIGRTLIREITSRGFNFLLRFLLDSKVTDGMCGFKFLKKSCFIKLQKMGLKRSDWFFNSELLIRSEWVQFSIKELPVVWTDDPSSNVKIINLSKSYLKSILALRREKHELRKSRKL